MTDQVKYTQKLAGKKVLIIGGSAGVFYHQPLTAIYRSLHSQASVSV